MIRRFAAIPLWCTVVSLTTVSVHAQVREVSGSSAIADTITLLFADMAEATTALDVDRILTHYADSDALTYVARGRVTRSRAAFAALVRAQLGGLASANLRWLDTYVDVLSDDVAVATATYELTVRLPDGTSVQTAGTYMCIYVRQGERWLIQYSSHTFPQ